MLQTQTVNPELLELLRALTYFEDADAEPTPLLLLKESWLEIKDNLLEVTRDFLSKR